MTSFKLGRTEFSNQVARDRFESTPVFARGALSALRMKGWAQRHLAELSCTFENRKLNGFLGNTTWIWLAQGVSRRSRQPGAQLVSEERGTDRSQDSPSVESLYVDACEGNRAAVREIVVLYNTELLRVARGMGLPEADAVDVVQFVWMRFFEHLLAVSEKRKPQLDHPELVRYWLLTTCRNAVRDVYRRRARDVRLTERKTSEDATLGRMVIDDRAASGIASREVSEALRGALAQLSETDRELVVLLIADPPLSYESIAEILGRPLGSIGPMRKRCLERLRVVLKGAGHE